MRCQATEKQEKIGALERCAVIKVDFRGRIVYVDEQAEQLFSIPCENLFGRSIKEFLDKESFNILSLALQNRKHYETHYQAADLIFTDSQQNRFAYGAVISLNIIAGTPANYQIIITPFYERGRQSSDPAGDSEISRLLFDFACKLGRNVDWKSLCGVFLKMKNVVQIGIYMYDGSGLGLIASEPPRENVKERVDLNATDGKHVAVAVQQKPLADEGTFIDNSTDTAEVNQFTDASYPLAQGDCCWGVLRIVHVGDHAGMDPGFCAAANFLGNVLFSFVSDRHVTGPVTV